MRTLIAEDSREDLLNLCTLLERIPRIEIIGEAHTLDEARREVARHAHELVFLDIERCFRNSPLELELGRAAAKRFAELDASA